MCLLLTSCISCSNNDKKSGFQPPIKGLQWGMTSDKVIKALNLTDANILHDDGKSITLSYENTSVFDQEANIVMFFDMESEIGLLELRVNFSDFNRDDLINRLNNTYGEYTAIDDNWIACQWESKKVVDLPQKIQDRFKYINVEHPSKVIASDELTDATLWDNIQNQPLVTVTINEDTLIYRAEHMAAYTVIKNDKTYNKMVEKINNKIENK